MSRGDGPFKVLAKAGTYVYKSELPGDMVVSATFNVDDLSPYVEDTINYRDLRENPFKGGEDDTDQGPYQDPRPRQKKTMLITHHQSQFNEGLQFNFEAYLGRSYLC